MGRLCVGSDLLDFEEVVCFDEDAGDTADFGECVETEEVSLCWVWIRVFTTSSGVVMTPAMPPALAAVAISNGKPMLFESM